MKKTLLAGASALALVAFSGGAYADHPVLDCTGVSDCNAGSSLEANDNPGAVAQDNSEAKTFLAIGTAAQGKNSTAAEGEGNFAQDGGNVETKSGVGTSALGNGSTAVAGDGNINLGSGVVQAGDGGNAIYADGESMVAADGSFVGGFKDADTVALDGGLAMHDVAIAGDNSLVIQDNDGVIATGQAAALRNEGGSFTALNDSTGVKAESVDAIAVNGSTAIADGAYVAGDGIAIGKVESGAVAIGGGFAVNDTDDSFNEKFSQIALSDVNLEQKLTNVSMLASAGEILGGASSGSAGGGTLSTGAIAASVASNTGITTANFNTGIANQGAAVSIGAVASF